MTGLLLAALLTLTPAETLSGSSDPATEADFRCYTGATVMAGMATMTGEGEGEVMQAAALLAFYYLGRLEGREPGVDWINRGIEVGNVRPQEMLAELDRCGKEFEAKGQEMITKGEAGLS